MTQILAGALAVLLGFAPRLEADSAQFSREPASVAYYRGLALWAGGRQIEGLERLLELDASPRSARFDWVARASDLGRGRPEVLVAVLAAHGELHALEIERAASSPAGSYLLLAAEQRRDLGQLAARYLGRVEARRGDRAALLEAKRIVARLWCRVAVTLREHAEIDAAAELFKKATQLDPDLATAHHALGALEEKLGHYNQAARHLERVLEIAPDHDEARLRLALCQARGGRSERASEQLQRLVRDAETSWVRTLAYEEWAQLELREQQAAESLEIVEEGRRAFPASERLALLELFLRADRTPASAELVATLFDSKGFEPDEATPRALYNRWPKDLETTLADFEADTRASRPLLAEATRRWQGAEP